MNSAKQEARIDLLLKMVIPRDHKQEEGNNGTVFPVESIEYRLDYVGVWVQGVTSTCNGFGSNSVSV